MKTETYLPIFPGFYDSILVPDETNEIDHINEQREENGIPGEITWEHCDFNFQKQFENISKDCCNILENKLQDYVKSIDYQSLFSPRFYNYTTDSVNVLITMTRENIKNIRKAIKDNMEDYRQYIKDRYTSCDGFISSYSNNVADWMPTDENLSDAHKLGSMLEFICSVEGVEQDIYLESENLNIFIVNNYDQLITESIENL